MSHKNFEKTDNTENVENIEKKDKPEGTEKENILNKVKDFFAEYGKKTENKEKKESKEELADSKQEEKQERKSWEFSPEDKEKINESSKEIADKFRAEHNLDEHGYSLDKNAKRPEGGYERERGDDGLHSRWEDIGDEKNIENNESDNKKDDNEEE